MMFNKFKIFNTSLPRQIFTWFLNNQVFIFLSFLFVLTTQSILWGYILTSSDYKVIWKNEFGELVNIFIMVLIHLTIICISSFISKYLSIFFNFIFSVKVMVLVSYVLKTKIRYFEELVLETPFYKIFTQLRERDKIKILTDLYLDYCGGKVMPLYEKKVFDLVNNSKMFFDEEILKQLLFAEHDVWIQKKSNHSLLSLFRENVYPVIPHLLHGTAIVIIIFFGIKGCIKLNEVLSINNSYHSTIRGDVNSLSDSIVAVRNDLHALSDKQNLLLKNSSEAFKKLTDVCDKQAVLAEVNKRNIETLTEVSKQNFQSTVSNFEVINKQICNTQGLPIRQNLVKNFRSSLTRLYQINNNESD